MGRKLGPVADVLIAMALIGVLDNLVRLIAGSLGLWQFLSMRSAVVLLLLGLWIRLAGRTFGVRDRAGVFLRSLVASGALVLYFASLGAMPVPLAASGFFTAPIFVLLISVALLRVRVGIWRVVGILGGFAGVVLALGPEGAEFGPVAVLPVAAGFLYGVSNLLARIRLAGEATEVLLAGFFAGLLLWGLLGMGLLAVLAPPGDGFVLSPPAWPTPEAVAVSAAHGMGAMVAVWFLTRAYQAGDTAVISALEYAMLPFGTIAGVVLVGDVPGPRALLGMALIVLSGMILAWRERRAARLAREASGELEGQAQVP